MTSSPSVVFLGANMSNIEASPPPFLPRLLYEAVEIAIVIARQHETMDDGSTNVGHRSVPTARSTIIELLADAHTALALENSLWIATTHGQIAILFLLQCGCC